MCIVSSVIGLPLHVDSVTHRNSNVVDSKLVTVTWYVSDTL